MNERHAPHAESVLRVWPLPWHEVLVRAATADDDGAVRAWNRLRRDLTLAEILEDAPRLLPAVARRVTRADPHHRDVADLRAIHRQVWATNTRILAASLPKVEMLSKAGFDPLVLKGGALVGAVYGDLGARAMTDVDVIVRARDFDAALDALEAEGMTTTEDRTRTRRMWHGIGLADGTAAVDLHHLMSSWLPFDEEALWARSEQTEVLGHTIRVPAPADLFTHAVVHGVRPNDPVNLRWIVDAHSVAARRPDLDWAGLVERLTGPAVPLVLDATTYLVSRFSTPVPASVVSALSQRHVSRGDAVMYRISVTGDLGPVAGRLPGLMSEWVRTRRGQGLGAAIRDLPDFLAEMWELGSPNEIPGEVTRKLRRQTRRLTGRNSES
jgi:hypothetical protein